MKLFFLKKLTANDDKWRKKSCQQYTYLFALLFNVWDYLMFGKTLFLLLFFLKNRYIFNRLDSIRKDVQLPAFGASYHHINSWCTSFRPFGVVFMHWYFHHVRDSNWYSSKIYLITYYFYNFRFLSKNKRFPCLWLEDLFFFRLFT